jgi:hypothetical protein
VGDEGKWHTENSERLGIVMFSRKSMKGFRCFAKWLDIQFLHKVQVHADIGVTLIHLEIMSSRDITALVYSSKVLTNVYSVT